MGDTLVIIPTYNERENITRIVPAVLAACPACDVLVVDDNSPDGTGKLADGLSAENPRVKVLHRQEKNGLGRAYIAGFTQALAEGYEYVMEMDADFSHDPKDVPRIRQAVAEGGADLALGSRYVGGIRVLNWPMGRLLLSTGAALYVRLITGMPFSDPTGGFKCYRRKVLETIPLERVRSNGYSFQIEMTHTAWRNGFAIEEVPITFLDRSEGVSKMSGGIVNEALWMVWKLLARAGFRRSPGKKKA